MRTSAEIVSRRRPRAGQRDRTARGLPGRRSSALPILAQNAGGRRRQYPPPRRRSSGQRTGVSSDSGPALCPGEALTLPRATTEEAVRTATCEMRIEAVNLIVTLVEGH